MNASFERAIGNAEPAENQERRRKPLSKEYFDLQLKFADVVAQKTGITLEHVVFTHTNLFARLSFGNLKSLDETNPAWHEFVRQLVGSEDRTAYAYGTYLRRPSEERPSDEATFGCFSADPVRDDGVVRFHFRNNDEDGRSPLAQEKVADRKNELAALFGWIKRTYGKRAKTVRGNSWLYGMEAYQRLFPESYIQSRRIVRYSARFQGTSRWGQFLNYKGEVIEEVKDHFFDNLAKVDTEHIADAFPLPTYATEAPIDDFYEYYGIASNDG